MLLNLGHFAPLDPYNYVAALVHFGTRDYVRELDRWEYMYQVFAIDAKVLC